MKIAYIIDSCFTIDIYLTYHNKMELPTMKITDIDKNFLQKSADEDTAWIDAKSHPFKIYGVIYDDENAEFTRMPKNVSTMVSENVASLSRNTAGGRLTFRTNSTNISIKYSFPNLGIMSHMPITGSNGVAIYVDGVFKQCLRPIWVDYNNGETVSFTAKEFIGGNGQMKDIKIYFPLYGGVKDFYIGLDNGSELEKADEYTYTNPVVYYGSSITQGGCASRPGNDYESHIERWLNADFVNLGFSGSAKGELAVADYIVSLNPSVVVMDYDHNAPDVAHLKNTHYTFYKRIRLALPQTPIIFVTKPDYYSDVEDNDKRREVIKNTYLQSIQEGDKLTDYIDGKTLFGDEDYDACTVDSCHPNDLGFYRMAKTIYPHVKKFIK